jgi:hypothetical protein
MNYMADTLWLPETKDGYHFLLVLVDLGTNKLVDLGTIII